MPRGRPRKVKLEDLPIENSGLEKTLEIIREGQMELAKSIDKLGTRVSELETPKVVIHTDEGTTFMQKMSNALASSEYPIPADYRQAVAESLNKKFGIAIEYPSGASNFIFTIVVPKEYSSLSEAEYKERGADLRTRIISFSDGLNGVKAWAEKVYSSFDPETKAKIKAKLLKICHLKKEQVKKQSVRISRN